MAGSKEDVIEAGAWLRAERAKRGERCSGSKVAALATVLARKQGDPITIYQQQLTAIENADMDRGPKRLPPWFRYVRKLFEDGIIDETLDAMDAARKRPESGEDVLYIHDEAGARIGRIVWEPPAH